MHRLLTLILAAGLTACGNPNPHHTIADLIDHLNTGGLTVTEKDAMIAAMIGANDGASLTIAGEIIEVYEFDPDIPIQKNLLEKYRKNGFKVMGQPAPVITRGNIVVLIDRDHPKWPQIEAALTTF